MADNNLKTGLDDGPPIRRRSRVIAFDPARIRAFRKAAKITQAQAAECLGICRTNFIALEQGRRKMTGDEWAKLQKLYGLEDEAAILIKPPEPEKLYTREEYGELAMDELRSFLTQQRLIEYKAIKPLPPLPLWKWDELYDEYTADRREEGIR